MILFILNIVHLGNTIRGIEWSLRAFVSMRVVRLFFRARAVINFLMRAVNTFEITICEQRALRKFSVVFAPSNLADAFKTGQEA